MAEWWMFISSVLKGFAASGGGHESRRRGAAGRRRRARGVRRRFRRGSREFQGAAGSAAAPIATTSRPIAAISDSKLAMNRPVENTIVGSCVFQFKVDYELVKHLPTGMAFYSDAVSAGGHLWGIKFFPSGEYEADEEYVSIFLEHMSKSRSVGVIFEENFKKAIFTDGYALLVLKFPEIIAEMKKRV
uniref:MATH domain-containing protein n=1 Tax=Aegilops tauschii TaxID=37682 RepID=R7W3S9_AEGTA